LKTIAEHISDVPNNGKKTFRDVSETTNIVETDTDTDKLDNIIKDVDDNFKNCCWSNQEVDR
jgi:hypothetical protein